MSLEVSSFVLPCFFWEVCQRVRHARVELRASKRYGVGRDNGRLVVAGKRLMTQPEVPQL
jgi:hypothetical protein